MTNFSDTDIEKLARRIVEMGGNAGVTQRCVPLASGGLNPDSRVNYEFGLVLGVDEFRQEQFYHLTKNYLHNRGLHGYGVVSGLQVGLERTSDNDIRINVGTGVGVDQCGRTFIIRSDQCAYLRAWLERNQQDLDLTTGNLTLYVVGTYDECKDALVAIAGQPCASSEQSLAASRIRDSFNISLRSEPPAMPAWETIRRLAALLTRVRIVNGLPVSESDEATIAARVRVIDDPAKLAALDAPLTGYYGGEFPDYWRLPAEGINETLDRIFMVWVSEVRPRLTPTVIDGCGTTDPIETGILLGQMDIEINDLNAPIQFEFSEPAPSTSHAERPYLLQTQVIQELLFLGVGNERKPSRLFGSLFIQNEERLVLWLHHPETLVLADPTGDPSTALEVYINGQRVRATIAPSSRAAIRAQNVFDIAVPDGIPAAAQVEVHLLLAGWRVSEAVVTDQPTGPGRLLPGEIEIDRPFDRIRGIGRSTLDELRRIRLRTNGTTPLMASIDQFDFEYVGRTDDTIVLYAFAERLPEVREFVVPSRRFDTDTPQIRLWFPFDAPLNLDEATNRGRALTVTNQATNRPLPFRISRTNDPRVWLLVATDNIEDLNNALLVLDFAAEVLNVRRRGVDDTERTLLAAMGAGQYSYTGFDGQTTIRVAFVPEQLQASDGGLSEADIIRIINQNRQPIPPNLPLASLQFLSTNFDNLATFELWFHLDLEWQRYETRIEDEFTLLVFAEVMEGGAPSLERLEFERRRVEERPNVFAIQVFSNGPPSRLQYLRFVFPVRERMTIESRIGGFASLDEYMRATGVRFENYYDIENATETPAVVLYGRAIMERGD
jgi:hypothetical protein